MRHANVAVFVPHIGCPHRCSFCDQRAITGQQKAPTPQDVRDAAEAGLRTLGAAAREAQIAFFGGSFTAIAPDYRRSLLEAAYPFVKSGQYAGIRLSTRPDAIDGEILDELRAFGVTAIELGAQSMDDAVLRQNGRGHTAEATRAAAQKIRDAGFSLGLQMMTGLFCDTDAGARRTAEEFAALLPREVRIYPALVLRGTALCDRYARGEYRPQTLEGAVALCTDLLTFFERRGIAVIRLGLHETPALDASFVAGPRHPAFGELCRARQYRLAVERAMRGGRFAEAVAVSPKDLSIAVGQHRQNEEALREAGHPVRFFPDAALARGWFALTDESGRPRRFRAVPGAAG